MKDGTRSQTPRHLLPPPISPPPDLELDWNGAPPTWNTVGTRNYLECRWRLVGLVARRSERMRTDLEHHENTQ